MRVGKLEAVADDNCRGPMASNVDKCKDLTQNVRSVHFLNATSNPS